MTDDTTNNEQNRVAADCPNERIVMLPVNTQTGEIDHCYLEYDLRTIEETQQEQFQLIDSWEFRPFKVVPAA